MNSLIPVESRRYHKRQIFEIENGRLAASTALRQKKWTDALAKLLLRIKETVCRAKSNLQTALTSRQQNIYVGRYDTVIRHAEQIVRGSPKQTGVYLFICPRIIYIEGF